MTTPFWTWAGSCRPTATPILSMRFLQKSHRSKGSCLPCASPSHRLAFCWTCRISALVAPVVLCSLLCRVTRKHAFNCHGHGRRKGTLAPSPRILQLKRFPTEKGCVVSFECVKWNITLLGPTCEGILLTSIHGHEHAACQNMCRVLRYLCCIATCVVSVAARLFDVFGGTSSLQATRARNCFLAFVVRRKCGGFACILFTVCFCCLKTCFLSFTAVSSPLQRSSHVPLLT